MICIEGPTRDLSDRYIDVGGYHMPPSAAVGYGEVVHRGEEI